MFRVLLAERAIFAHYQSVRIVLFVLDAVVVSVLTFGTFERNFSSSGFGCHNKTPCKKITPRLGCANKVYHT